MAAVPAGWSSCPAAQCVHGCGPCGLVSCPAARRVAWSPCCELSESAPGLPCAVCHTERLVRSADAGPLRRLGPLLRCMRLPASASSALPALLSAKLAKGADAIEQLHAWQPLLDTGWGADFISWQGRRSSACCLSTSHPPQRSRRWPSAAT